MEGAFNESSTVLNDKFKIDVDSWLEDDTSIKARALKHDWTQYTPEQRKEIEARSPDYRRNRTENPGSDNRSDGVR